MPSVSIASGSQISADAGATVANQGGNAVDAALAATLVAMCTDLGVMAPGASGFINISPPAGEPVVIDAYAEMPGRGLDFERFGKGMEEVFFDYGGSDVVRTMVGYGTIATPGIFAGLAMASQKYGKLPWENIVAPCLQWAEQGFPLLGGAADYLLHTHKAIFSWHPESYRALHHDDGSPLVEGEIVHIPGLADSLRLIAQEGVATFYTGELGQRIVAEIQANQGLLTVEDLAAYRAIERSPICIAFDEWEIITNPPPAVGGACLAAMLLLLERQSFREWNPQMVQKLAEIQQAVLEYRQHYLHEDNSLAEVTQLLELAGMGNHQKLLKSPSTIHISTVDSDGMACSVTASAGYGSGVMVSGTGLWLNNSLGEMELHPQGLHGLTPGTRLVSNMAPAIARHPDGRVLAIGSPGASRITTAIAQVLLNYLHLGMSLEEAIAHPRLHYEVLEKLPTIVLETGVTVGEIEGFITHEFPGLSMYFGGVQAALWSPRMGLSAAADPRRAGGVAYCSE
ncbi:gamma-glutamyltransferase [Calothrix sp. UHCC 0171]|uniref:gamma-glutamyltransferase n=1 Tax=Calothrix sp. UHCC 0171 TaxID=3110245 RepID=UPI002B1F9BBD|nr:gamma-glutamyltransferase [Calothrix sp. UHCC 0171]MEA5572629.1 gamma-glutamyltransferase [Calothrix sp. UHCC 0171]